MPDYFTEAELRALPDMSGESTARITAAAAWATGIIERECNTSFIVRTITDEPHEGGSDAILLDRLYAQSSPAPTATSSGVAVAGTMRLRHGVLRVYNSATSTTPGRWPDGLVLVTYSSGYSATPPTDIKEAALSATRWHLLEGRATNTHSPRQTSITNEMGGTVMFATAGPDRPTGYPDVDAVIVGWRTRLNTVTYP